MDDSKKDLTYIKTHPQKPQHIGIIMDGNGRWAKKRFFPKIAGHREGTKVVKKIVQLSSQLEITSLSIYAFSTENWQRPQKEIKGLFSLLVEVIKREVNELHNNNVIIKFIGRRKTLSENIVEKLDYSENLTKSNSGLLLNVCFNYSGRTEIVDFVKEIAKDVKQEKLSLDEIDENLIAKYLYQPQINNIDLIIRTSGEFRVSNFLLWEIAYSEFWITKTLWPDFTEIEFMQAIKDFINRNRRFGKS